MWTSPGLDQCTRSSQFSDVPYRHSIKTPVLDVVCPGDKPPQQARLASLTGMLHSLFRIEEPYSPHLIVALALQLSYLI